MYFITFLWHCVKYARILVFRDPHFPVQGQNRRLRENIGQRKPVLWHILRRRGKGSGGGQYDHSLY